MDIKIYVETPDDIRFIRRISRDVDKRNRTVNSVIEQYLKTVRPMHQQFVEPSKYFADIIIPEGSQNKVAIDLIRTKINLVPESVKEIRIVDIVGLDKQADGGTHVSSTSQVGRMEVVKTESKGKGFKRIRFVVHD